MPIPMPDEARFDGYLSKTEAIPFELALRVVGIERRACGRHRRHAGRAFGLARVGAELPMMSTRGRLFLPNVASKLPGYQCG